VLSYIFESYFNSQTKEIFSQYPKIINFTKYILYKTPDIIKKTPSINEIIINDNYPIDRELTFNKYIRIVSIYSNNNSIFDSQLVIHPIANLQHIYSLKHINLNSYKSNNVYLCNYIYETNFLMKCLQKNIPPGITSVNILYDYASRFGFTDDFPLNFPTSTRQIRINILYVKESVKYCADICGNLPINLQKLIITYCDYSKINYYVEKCDMEIELNDKIKLPIGCRLIFDKFLL
jgi:hypothetical protein